MCLPGLKIGLLPLWVDRPVLERDESTVLFKNPVKDASES